ncbi:hypothetical protein FRB99_004880 [Tulasnella sp. 403]|nr:hypothetical protein FRB99_004880 [Tulasnella sp. 403]
MAEGASARKIRLRPVLLRGVNPLSPATTSLLNLAEKPSPIAPRRVKSTVQSSMRLLRDLIGTPETPLLPRLSRLVLTADGHLFVRQTAALLLSPSISSLHIRSGSYKYWGPETLINTFWEEIQAQSSNVKCLNVKSTATAPSYDSFTNLVSLHQTNVAMHPTVWKEFESCPHLEFVSINGPFVDYAPAPRRPPVVTLESVRQVDLGNSFSINHTVDLQMPGLRSLKMQASRRFLETVGRSSRSVEFVQLTFPSTLGFSDLQPLTAFRKLHTLHLGYRNPARTSVNLTDEDIQSFASNMGHLENFSMYPVDPPSADTECRLRLTASSLASFAAHCKSLNTLKIVFCASRMEDLSSMPAFSSLRSLQLACVCVAPGLEAQLGRILAEKCPRGVELKVLSAPLHEVHPACKGEDDGTRCRRVEESFRAFF